MFDTLFLDRDGVINKKIDNGYVLKVSDVVILPGIKEVLLLAKKEFKHIVVITNQRCISRDMLTLKKLGSINQYINELTGALIDEFFVCPHLDENKCECRKPKDGLFLQAKEKFNIDFKNSLMIGDSETDLIPAKKNGIRTIFVSKKDSIYANLTIDSLEKLKSFVF